MDRADWISLTEHALNRYETPFYLFALPPVEERLSILSNSLASANIDKPLSFLLSVKTLPLPHLAKEWYRRSRAVEVVSPTELSMCLNAGVTASSIVVNGVGKHHWLLEFSEPFLTLIFDSLSEIRPLLSHATRLNWRLGIRLAVSSQVDPDEPAHPAQFGMDPGDAHAAATILTTGGARVEVVHFHLRSNIRDVASLQVAIQECREFAETISPRPRILDVGGGIPDFDVRQRAQSSVGSTFLADYARCLASASAQFDSLDALWLESGRYLLGPAGVLVVSVVDTKWIRGYRFLICDGGRTNHALESDWEDHLVIPVGPADGTMVPTTVCGPTCMAYDWISRGPLSDQIAEGDRLIYLNAGAYHLPWETRFSQGLCRVLWSIDGQDVREVRPAESPEAASLTWLE